MPNEHQRRVARFDAAERLIRFGFFANLVLMVVKLLAGRFGHSEAVFADGIENGCDLVVTLGTLLAVRISRAPSDTCHPYGHGRVENIAALLIGAVILATGVWILIAAGVSIFELSGPKPNWIAVATAGFTIIVKEVMARGMLNKGKQIKSPAIVALGRDYRKDALTSIATLVGAAGAMLGVFFMDAAAAALTAVFIFRAGWQVFISAAHELMDAALPAEQMREISRLAESVAGVDAVHEIRGRRAGQYIIIDLKLEMDGAMSVRKSHKIATLVKRKIFVNFPEVGDVMIHVNPHNDPDHEDLIRL
jgi:cation diffusion facilitator family transporter